MANGLVLNKVPLGIFIDLFMLEAPSQLAAFMTELLILSSL
jgi:hypothetical protein